MKNNIDFIKIDGGRSGVINLNNMIPVLDEGYSLISINEIEKRYRSLLLKQLKWMNVNYDYITNKAYQLYNRYNEKRLPTNIHKRCCNFHMLEKKGEEYHLLYREFYTS